MKSLRFSALVGLLVSVLVSSFAVSAASASKSSTTVKGLNRPSTLVAKNNTVMKGEAIVVTKKDDKAPEAKPAVSGKVVIVEELPIHASGNWTRFAGDIGYNFYKSYSLGVSGSYSHPYGESEIYEDGFGDIGIGLGDGEFVNWEKRMFTVAAGIGYVKPISSASRKATMVEGFKAGMTMTQKWNTPFTTIWESSIARYFHQYDAVGNTYNKPYSWSNEFSVLYQINDKWRWAATGGIATALSYTEGTEEEAEAGVVAKRMSRESQFLLNTGLAYQAFSNLSLRMNVRSARSEFAKQALFDAATTMFRLGAVINF